MKKPNRASSAKEGNAADSPFDKYHRRKLRQVEVMLDEPNPAELNARNEFLDALSAAVNSHNSSETSLHQREFEEGLAYDAAYAAELAHQKIVTSILNPDDDILDAEYPQIFQSGLMARAPAEIRLNYRIYKNRMEQRLRKGEDR